MKIETVSGTGKVNWMINDLPVLLMDRTVPSSIESAVAVKEMPIMRRARKLFEKIMHWPHPADSTVKENRRIIYGFVASCDFSVQLRSL